MMGGMGADPLANLQDEAVNADSTGGATGNQIFNVQVAQKNSQEINRSRTTMAILSGMATGIFGFTAYQGLWSFLVFHVITGLGLAFLRMEGGNVKKYTQYKSLWGFLLSFGEIQECGMSFMLFWTMFYGCTYLF